MTLAVCYRDGELETIELSEDFVNPGQPRTRPQDFELLKLLGKGGYGKVLPSLLDNFFITGISLSTVLLHVSKMIMSLLWLLLHNRM